MPCWLGIDAVGIGVSISTLGTISGITPKTAYFASSSATRPSAGIAGNGIPLKSSWSMTAVTSSPVMTRLEWLPSAAGATWWSVITPSASTIGGLPRRSP